LDFLLSNEGNQDPLMIGGSCKNITVDPPVMIPDAEWGELLGDDGVLDKADLVGQTFEIGNDDPDLWGLVVACYEPDEMVVCMKIVSVHNLINHGNGTYSADVIMLRAILPKN
jgi:hypothetical protein